MIQAITDGIIAALLSVFPGVTVYFEQVKQGLKEPCFIVRCVSPTSERRLGSRRYRRNLFSVQYIPESGTDANAERYAVLEALFQLLEYITVNGDLMRGTEMRGEMVGGALTFLVNFNMFTKKTEETEPMEELKIDGIMSGER